MSAVLQSVPRAAVTQRRGASSTEYSIIGALGLVFAEIELVFIEYPPMGYGTRVASIESTNKDGIYAARMSRSNSCE